MVTTGRAYSSTIHWLLRSRYGRRVGAIVTLAIFRGVAYLERHDTNPVPPGERFGPTWVAKRRQDIDE